MSGEAPPGEKDPLLKAGAEGGESKTTDRFSPAARFLDHFSLESPSDAVRFRSNSVRVYSSGTHQFQIVEYNDDTDANGKKGVLKAKVTSDGSSGLSLLRACYTLVSVLMTGFLLIFCLQTLLFLFVSLVMEGGFTSKQHLNAFHLIGTILSIPVFVYGLASALTMASEFVLDTWQGHVFFRTILRWNATYIDWIAFALFLMVPLLVMLYRMFSNPHWWEATALAWFACVTTAYALFCFAVFVYEIWGALELLSHHPKYELIDLNLMASAQFLKRAILLRQYHSYAGVRHKTFYMEGSSDLPTPDQSYDQSELADHEHVDETFGYYSQWTQKFPNWFTQFETPVRQFHVEDVLDRTVFITDATWNLEKLFCRRQKARSVLVVNGTSRVLDSQVKSSFACAILGNALILLTFIALLWWGGASVFTVIILTAFFIFMNRRAFRRVYVLWDTYQDTRRRRSEAENETSSGSEAVFQVTETHRVSQPTDKLCWIMFGLELFALFIFPLWMLLDVGNKAIAFLFLILGSFSAFRHYFNAPVVLSELGSLDLLDGQFLRTRAEQETGPEVEEQDWREKNRLSKIVGKISQGARRDTWMKVITAFVLIFLALFLMAFSEGSNSGNVSDTSNLLDDFRYAPQEGMAYPTCSMTPDFQIPGSNTTAMADYAYMASIAYIAPESMPASLDAWFGDGVAYDDVDVVSEFRTEEADSQSAVHYKLITFPKNPDFAVMTIRGTSNGWDMISDAQLWSASFLAQMVRSILPCGEIWNPILENLVNMIGVLQDESLKKVSFYVHTVNFVNWLHSKKMYPLLRVTGHSLGGGLAMITGAQTKTPSIGLSGPNTVITRDTLHPPVTVENLDKYTFNIVPDRDVVPMIDDFSKNIQKINCLAATNNFIDCHTSVRSLCEIQYTCGSAPRPTLCDCALYYGYPEPQPTGDRTFAEACKK